jgi:fumarylacetoacetase
MLVLDQSWSWRSWLASANAPGSQFPLQNLPFCVFQPEGEELRPGVGIGDQVLDLAALVENGLLESVSEGVRAACSAPTLNDLMAQGRGAATELRDALMTLLEEGVGEDQKAAVKALLRPMRQVTYGKPVTVGGYTDFYSSIQHATNVGRMFRPEDPLLPNYKYVPIGYHGRTSSIVLSGTPVERPCGQVMEPGAEAPEFLPTRQLDYEMELGAYIGTGNALGERIGVNDAEDHIFGLTVMNDWSARDIQAWEYQPLGPFLGKNFATSVSPWVVTLDALAPYRMPRMRRPEGDPEPLPYLATTEDTPDGLDIRVEVYLWSAKMQELGLAPVRISAANTRGLYWSFAQMVAHHTSNGCNLQTGDLLGSGAISGPLAGMQGSLLEIARRGEKPFRLPTGETRSFLEDDDVVILHAFCQRAGLPRIGLGECRGMVVPASLSGRAPEKGKGRRKPAK